MVDGASPAEPEESDRPTLVALADTGDGVGLGHLARAVALVEAWTDLHGQAHLVAAEVPFGWRRHLEAEGVAVATEPPDGPAHWLVLDGYGLRPPGPAGGSRLLHVRDGAFGPDGTADGVVDPNLTAAGAGGSLRLAGPRYGLLRRPFRRHLDPAGQPLEPPEPGGDRPTVVVVMGGRPGPAARHLADAVAADPRLAPAEVRVLSGDADTARVAAGATVALSAAGSTVLELCALGVPSVLVVAADNQGPVAEAAEGAGVAVSLGPLGVCRPADAASAVLAVAGDPGRRLAMRRRGLDLVDGWGALRVATAMRAALVTCRPATVADAETLWRWSNDPDTRRWSFRSDPISWEEHRRWLAALLGNPRRRLYVAVDHRGVPLGQVRLEAEGPPDQLAISVALDPDRRGHGWAGAVVLAGVDRYGIDVPDGPPRVVARIKPDNRASVRAFVGADFAPDSATDDLVVLARPR